MHHFKHLLLVDPTPETVISSILFAILYQLPSDVLWRLHLAKESKLPDVSVQEKILRYDLRYEH